MCICVSSFLPPFLLLSMSPSPCPLLTPPPRSCSPILMSKAKANSRDELMQILRSEDYQKNSAASFKNLSSQGIMCVCVYACVCVCLSVYVWVRLCLCLCLYIFSHSSHFTTSSPQTTSSTPALYSPFTPPLPPPPPPLPSPLLSSLYTSASRRLPLQANWRQFRNCQKKFEKNKKNAGKLETISQLPSIVQGGSRVGSPLSGSRSLSRQKSLSLSLEGSSSKSGPSSRENSKQSLGSPPRPLLSKVIYQ